MVDYRDILVNISPIIYLILTFILSKSILRDSDLLFILNIFLYGAFHHYISGKIIAGHGHIFPTVITLVIVLLTIIYFLLYVIINLKLNIIIIPIILVYVYGIIKAFAILLYRLTNGEITDYIYDILGFDCIKLFESIIENDWFKGVSIGIIGTVCGGLILDKIRNKK